MQKTNYNVKINGVVITYNHGTLENLAELYYTLMLFDGTDEVYRATLDQGEAQFWIQREEIKLSGSNCFENIDSSHAGTPDEIKEMPVEMVLVLIQANILSAYALNHIPRAKMQEFVRRLLKEKVIDQFLCRQDIKELIKAKNK